MKTDKIRVVAFAIDNLESVKISLTEEYLGTGCSEDCQLFSKYRYTVRKDDIEEWTDWSGEIEAHSYRRIKPAWEKFKELIDGVRNGLGERRIKTVNLCDGFIEDYEDDIDPQPYCRSASAGDYSPSCPWNAPGMSIHDFI
jgi:hypothetical protein